MPPSLNPRPLSLSPGSTRGFLAIMTWQGEGVVVFQADGSGPAAPVPFGSFSPLSAGALTEQCRSDAESGERGVRAESPWITRLPSPPPREEV
jgi:hypothetical protein